MFSALGNLLRIALSHVFPKHQRHSAIAIAAALKLQSYFDILTDSMNIVLAIVTLMIEFSILFPYLIPQQNLYLLTFNEDRCQTTRNQK